MVLKIIVLVISILMVIWLFFDNKERKFYEPPRNTAPYVALFSFLIVFMLFDIATSNVRHKQKAEKVYAEYEVVDKFTTIKKGEVYYYVELVYIDDYELYDDKDQNIIHELMRYSDYEYYNKGSVIKIEIKVVIPK